VAFIDEQGFEQRRERYSPGEITERLQFLYDHRCDPTACAQASQEQQERHRLIQARHKEIEAATQPAR
jgi:hypothetical protein